MNYYRYIDKYSQVNRRATKNNTIFSKKRKKKISLIVLEDESKTNSRNHNRYKPYKEKEGFCYNYWLNTKYRGN